MAWFFGRRKSQQLTATMLAQDLVKPIVTGRDIEFLQQILQNFGQAVEISEQQRREWIALILIAIARGALARTESEALRRRLAPELQRLVYDFAFKSDADRTSFEELFFKRSAEYSAALAASSEAPNRLGLLFANNIVGSLDIGIALICRKLFHERMMASQQFVSQVASFVVVD